jgi:hypothetical protein
MKEEVEQVDEAMSSYDRNRKRAAQRAEARNEARRRGQTGNVPGVGYVSPRPERSTYRDESGVERHHTGARMPKKEDQKESFDLFDVILEHLVVEGYADTNKAALAIMANMSEEWRQSIVEAYQEPRFGKKDYIKKLSKRGGMGMGTPEDPHGYRDPKMAKVGAEFSKRKTAAAKAKKTGEPDSYRAEKEAQSKNR